MGLYIGNKKLTSSGGGSGMTDEQLEVLSEKLGAISEKIGAAGEKVVHEKLVDSGCIDLQANGTTTVNQCDYILVSTVAGTRYTSDSPPSITSMSIKIFSGKRAIIPLFYSNASSNVGLSAIISLDSTGTVLFINKAHSTPYFQYLNFECYKYA